MEDLTLRQIDILKAIIKEYTDAGGAIGSEILEKKYKLGISPATIRNEMVELTKKEYLKKEYFSSGRVPSAKAFRFYIKNLMKEKELSTVDEVAYKNSIWDERADAHRLLAQATHTLAEKTGLLSVSTTNLGDLYYSGVGNLLAIEEFLDWKLSRCLFDRLDVINFWESILTKSQQIEDDSLFMLGEADFSDPLLEPCASIFCDFEGEKIKGMIGVVGPKRMYYEIVTPQIKYFSTLIGDILREQKI